MVANLAIVSTQATQIAGTVKVKQIFSVRTSFIQYKLILKIKIQMSEGKLIKFFSFIFCRINFVVCCGNYTNITIITFPG